MKYESFDDSAAKWPASGARSKGRETGVDEAWAVGRCWQSKGGEVVCAAARGNLHLVWCLIAETGGLEARWRGILMLSLEIRKCPWCMILSQKNSCVPFSI